MRWILNYKNGKSPKRSNYASVNIDKYIFIFGGYCENGEINQLLTEPTPIDCLVFDTSTLKWHERPKPEKHSAQTPYFRCGHTCVNYNGYVILWGGWADWTIDSCNLVYKYDPKNHLWDVIESNNTPPIGRDGHSACTIGNSMLIFGGYIKQLKCLTNQLFEFNFLTQSWTLIETSNEQKKPNARDFHTASVIDTNMYIFGGRTNLDMSGHNRDTEDYPNDLFVFDLSTRQWTEIIRDQTYLYLNRHIEYIARSVVPCGRRSHSAAVNGDKILIFGGFIANPVEKHFNDMYEFDTVRMTWRRLDLPGLHPHPRRRHSSHIVNGQMFVFGGSGPINSDYEPHMESCLLEHFNANQVVIYHIYMSLFKRIEKNMELVRNSDNQRQMEMFIALRARLMAIGYQLKDIIFNNRFSSPLHFRNLIAQLDEIDDTTVCTYSDLHIIQINLPSLKYLSFLAIIESRLDYSQLPLDLQKDLDNMITFRV